MKKVIMGFVLTGLLIGGAFSNAQAQEKKLAFSLNLGVQTNLYSESSFDNAWFTLDARVGVPIGESLEISPEVMAAVDDSLDFSALWLYPGLMLNFKLGRFFVGAGAVLPIVFYEGGSDSGNLAPKINMGWSAGSVTLTAYLFTWTEENTDFLEYNFIGATIGYRF
jgi:hypothetical protein